jgi:tetratricopeptide (TPR) repeat protein
VQFLAAYPESPKTNLAVFQLGKYYYRSKKYAKAIENLEKINIMNLGNDDVIEYHFAMGYSYFQLNEYEKGKAFAGGSQGHQEQILFSGQLLLRLHSL